VSVHERYDEETQESWNSQEDHLPSSFTVWDVAPIPSRAIPYMFELNERKEVIIRQDPTYTDQKPLRHKVRLVSHDGLVKIVYDGNHPTDVTH
jgi:hypothetical protein